MKSLLNPWVILGVVLAILGAFGGGYWRGGVAKANSIEAQTSRDTKLVQSTADRVLQGTAGLIAGIKVQNTVINRKAVETIREVPVYQECRNTPEVKALIQEAMK